MGTKIVAGSLAGALAGAVSNPVDLIKVRMQKPGAGDRSPAAIVREVVRADGVAGLWRGTVPGMTRAAVLTASQCATYDEAKRAWMAATGMGENFGTYIAASMMAGVVTTTATSPVDVLKTHMFASSGRAGGASLVQVLVGLVREQGWGCLFRGWTANWTRLGPQTAITFVANEELRHLLGLEHF